MALSYQKTALCQKGRHTQSSRRVLARPVRAAVDYQSPSTRTGANELQALARMSNVVSYSLFRNMVLLTVPFSTLLLSLVLPAGPRHIASGVRCHTQGSYRVITADQLDPQQ